MIYGLLKYRSVERNIGDFIQSMAAKRFFPKIDIMLSREELNHYNGDDLKIILNGWFMHEPINWPPSDNIKPLFVSFHINKSVADILTNAEAITYYKKHEPIGCRDLFTCDLLKSKGVISYFSGCLTLTLEREKYISAKHVFDVVVCDPFWKTYSFSEIFVNKDLNFLQKLIRIPFYIWKQNHNKLLVKKLIPKSKRKIKYLTHFLRHYYTTERKFEIAEEMLKVYASSKFVITGRIHAALPCLAFNTNVLYINPEKDTSRLNGLTDLFNVISIDELKSLSAKELQNKYVLDNISNSYKYRVLRDNLILKCEHFINENHNNNSYI